ncbi:MAG: hypothetical protein LBJ71_04625, partial [Holosporaceae bacterium]|nr:hypothetical protein [Holosporaceae bacterium]
FIGGYFSSAFPQGNVKFFLGKKFEDCFVSYLWQHEAAVISETSAFYAGILEKLRPFEEFIFEIPGNTVTSDQSI